MVSAFIGFAPEVSLSSRFESYLTFVDSSIGMADPLEDEKPVVRFCRVKDLKPRIGSKHQMSIGQNVEISSTNKRNLKRKKEIVKIYIYRVCHEFRLTVRDFWVDFDHF